MPEAFTFPFFYQPHSLSEIAAKKVQQFLTTQTEFVHDFGLHGQDKSQATGKMFGVLVVQDSNGNLGFLAGFSGKLGGTNTHSYFVPPVFDMLTEESFFLREVTVLNAINSQVDAIETSDDYQQLNAQLAHLQANYQKELAAFKAILKTQKQDRKVQRLAQKASLTPQEYQEMEADLIKQSLRDKHQLNVLIQKWEQQLTEVDGKLGQLQQQLHDLKEQRKLKSAELQQQLFEQYSFLNQDKASKSLHAIFKETVFEKPPAAAGECATPKTLQYAFLKGYVPLAMAEFWWGISPKSEIRQHQQYYPACTGKCEPILKHMLSGMKVQENPFLKNLGQDKHLITVYEDAYLIVVNKPADLLSVPGINVQDSVYMRLKAKWGNIEPLIIHRLDMPTSGLLVVAKTKEVHKNIQRQFLTRGVKKRYTALLSKEIEPQDGEINLPLMLDIINRPMQKVCFEQGKKSVTQFKVVERKDGQTRIHFWPLTGRTHQLRMHAAHNLGLNAPIVGDDLYGTPAERLMLHAAYLSFQHPITLANIELEVAEDF